MRVEAPLGPMDKVRRWNASVKEGTYVRVIAQEGQPWAGITQSLAYIDDFNRVVCKVLSSNPCETVVVPIDQLRPIR